METMKEKEQENRTFSQQVYRAVCRVPFGKVATYGQIAMAIGRPRAGRQVGRALSCCHEQNVPCHRIVNAKGHTAPGFAMQRQLLGAEGIPFLPDGRVDLNQCQYKGETDE